MNATGVRGAGKTSLIRNLQKKYIACRTPSATTRLQRENEISGDEYLFMDNDTYVQRCKSGQIIEWTTTFKIDHRFSPPELTMRGMFHPKYWPVPEPGVEIRTSVFGTTHIQRFTDEYAPDMKNIFLYAREEVCKKRVQFRDGYLTGTENESTIKRQLKQVENVRCDLKIDTSDMTQEEVAAQVAEFMGLQPRHW